MASRVRSTCAAIAVAMPLVTVTASPAAAASVGVFTFIGHGTVTPGLGLIPGTVTVTIDGTASVIGTQGVLQTYNCTITGTVANASSVAGFGPMNVLCGPIYLGSCLAAWGGVAWTVGCTDISGAVRGAHFGCSYTSLDTVDPLTTFNIACLGKYYGT